MKFFKRKPKVDPRLVELENENRALKNQVEYLVRTLRDTDDAVFNMTQQTSWDGMRPAFNKLQENMLVRKHAENNRIAEILRPELIKTYTQPQSLAIEDKSK